jgi:D-glucosaminate-6-phosphate ammonia-lyase
VRDAQGGLYDMSIHADLGVRPLVNADAMKTTLGGTLMPPAVVEAMCEGAGAFVDMFELQAAVSNRLAVLTRNEAAFVCTGASAGLVLTTLACMTGPDISAVGRLLQHGSDAIEKRDVIVQCGQRNPYDAAIRLAGGRIVQVGNILQTFSWELEAAVTERTAAVMYFAGRHLGFGCLGLDEVVAIAHARNVPVVCDAAAQLPPKENLWRLAERGADLVLFSGGKELRGPQSSGLIVGRRDLVEACAMHAAPHQRLGRAMKVGKEEMLGLLAAVQWYLDRDEARELAECDRIIAGWIDALSSIAGVSAERDFPGTDGRPLPRAIVRFNPTRRLPGAAVRDAMLDGQPAIAVAIAGPDAIYLNPELLRPGEEQVVLDRLRDVIGAAG